MRAFALALSLAACDSCGGTHQTPPPVPTTVPSRRPPPPPVDSGDACPAECVEAQKACTHPVVMTVDECAKACAVLVRNLDNSPHCAAFTVTCSESSACPKR